MLPTLTPEEKLLAEEVITHHKKVWFQPLSTEWAETLRARMWAREASRALSEALADAPRSADSRVTAHLFAWLCGLSKPSIND